ncbi:MAG TPA: hypothetical protein VNJ70_16610 [Thermoanaerobaculia bacterium]|nr:hypothetical protein [Thermoanaerobaculia bacterium]
MRRRVLAFTVLTTVLTAMLLAACGEANPILGNWTAEDADGRRHTLSFQKRGRALWAIEGQGVDENFEIRYIFDDESELNTLDLTGFDRGQLQGKTLYCILEWPSAAAFRMDCAPGEPTAEGESVRPAGFGDHALLYMKVTR